MLGDVSPALAAHTAQRCCCSARGGGRGICCRGWHTVTGLSPRWQNRSHLCPGFMQGRRPLVPLPAGVPGRQEKNTCVQRLLWRARSELVAAGARRRLQEQTACAPFSTTWWANTPPRCISKYDGSEHNKASCSIQVRKVLWLQVRCKPSSRLIPSGFPSPYDDSLCTKN